MSSDFEAYEQDFGTLTAEITNKIGRIPKLGGEEKTQLVLNVDKQLEEVRELMEQMDLEVRELPIQIRGMYQSRLKSYKGEMEKLEKDFKRSRIAYSDEVRNELLGEDAGSSESQRAHLLDNTEKLERSSRRLDAGYQIAVETVLSTVKASSAPSDPSSPVAISSALCVRLTENNVHTSSGVFGVWWGMSFCPIVFNPLTPPVLRSDAQPQTTNGQGGPTLR
uniref:Vesicle transport through interaction with t-SNAREs 1A n=1 Tax=Salmo trutta TaxID=8032 RepID=A0A674BA95_SALTR